MRVQVFAPCGEGDAGCQDGAAAASAVTHGDRAPATNPGQKQVKGIERWE
jgi:hypothetical protein